MKELRLLITAGLLSLTASGCELSLRDQVSLIHENESTPPAPTTTPILPGSKVQCATLGPLILVRSQGAKSAFVLDPRRAFYRWEATGASFIGDGLDGLRAYLSSYADYDSWGLWSRYGRNPFEPGETPTLSSGSSLAWQSFQLIDRKQYEAALSTELKPEQVKFLQQAGSEQIRLYLAVNDYKDATILAERYGRASVYSSEMTATVRVRRGAQVEELELYLPINTAMAPFVGHVGPMGIPPIR